MSETTRPLIFSLYDTAAMFGRVDNLSAAAVNRLLRRLKNFVARERLHVEKERGPREAALLNSEELLKARVLSVAIDIGLDDEALKAISTAMANPMPVRMVKEPIDLTKEHDNSMVGLANSILFDERWLLLVHLVQHSKDGERRIAARIVPDEGDNAQAQQILDDYARAQDVVVGTLRLPLNGILHPVAAELRDLYTKRQ